MVGHVQNRCTLGEFQQVAFGCEHKYLLIVEVQFELVHHLQVVASFQGRADVAQPLVEPCLTLHALVAPVGSQTAFGYLVHALGAYLHFHPLLLGSQHGDVQAFVAVGLGHTQPVAQTFGVGLIHVGHDGEGLPALHLLLFECRIDDDTDGKQVVNTLEVTLLLLHLLPDGVDGLCAALHVELQSDGLQPLPDGFDETINVGVAALLRGVQLLLDHVVGIVLQVLQRQVLELALQLVETQLMGKWGIEVSRLVADALLGVFFLGVAYLAHQVHAVGNHDENHAHVLGKRQ